MPIKKSTPADAEKVLAGIDWAKFDAVSDDEIALQIEDNPDAARELDPDFFKDASVMDGRRVVRRGRPRKAAGTNATPGAPADAVDIGSVRSRLGMTQSQFAEAYGFTIGNVRDLEQGRSKLTGPAAVLITLIDAEPETIREILARRWKRRIAPRGRAAGRPRKAPRRLTAG